MPDNQVFAPSVLPIFPMREQVVFPFMLFPLVIRPEGMVVIEEALKGKGLLGLVCCATPGEMCRVEDFFRVGTLCRITNVERQSDGSGKVTVEGLRRMRIVSTTQLTPYILAVVEVVEEHEHRGAVSEALMHSVHSMLSVAREHGRTLPEDVVEMIGRIRDPGRLADLVTVYLSLDMKAQQELLETYDSEERLKRVYLHLATEVQKASSRKISQGDATLSLRGQKEAVLRDHMKKIDEDLTGDDPRATEIKELRQKILSVDFAQEVRSIALKELGRLERLNTASPEYAVLRTYLEYLVAMPWGKGTIDNLDIDAAQIILDEDHHGLHEVKQRILEFLAVRALKSSSKGPILCFVGPPGVGKTSLGRSIARALGRKYIRMALGGMKDEAEVRGHRRTYVGAMPGRLVQAISRSEVNNPLIMLDEIDKIGQDFRGDPASALLEVLDPEQNSSFTDHYLDVPLDLSKVLFICTANQLDPIPGALRDRMEVIMLSGYSEEEKEQIAFRYLIAKEMEENGLANYPLEFSREAVRKIIRDYTREAGVRNLERKIASICRKVAREIAQGHPPHIDIDERSVEEMLGPKTFFSEVTGEKDLVGVVTGLAWTEAGGDILFIEASRMSGSKQLTITGHLGEVMQESVKAALSYVRSHAEQYGIESDFFDRSDLHVHVPAGAIPKDGPSAGVAIATALISLLTGRPVRRSLAMTGELTLTGQVLPIGGVREKVLAARRAGVRSVVLPERNRESLKEVEPDLLKELQIDYADEMSQVIALALRPKVLCTTGSSESGSCISVGPLG